MVKVKVKKVWDKGSTETLEPLKLQFEHAEFEVEKSGRDLSKYFTSHLYVPKSAGSSKQVVALENENMVYIGSTQNPQTLTSGSMKTYIGIKKGSRLTFYETTPVTVSPFIKEHSYIKEVDKDTSIKHTSKEKRIADVELAKAFGSKKKRLYLEKQEKNLVTDMNDSIMSAAAEAKEVNMSEELTDTSILKVIPPCNRDAALATEVYKISDMLSDQDMDELEEYATSYLEATENEIAAWKENDTFSDYFFGMLALCKFRKDDPNSIRSIKLALYAEILIRIYKLRPNQIRKQIPTFPDVYPISLVRKAFNIFTDVNALNHRTRSDEMKDKTCCYIMVLVLLSSDNNFDVQLMSTIFQIHIKKLLTLAKAVGMTIKYNSVSKSYNAVLRLPLPKQIEKRGAQRRLRK